MCRKYFPFKRVNELLIYNATSNPGIFNKKAEHFTEQPYIGNV